MRAELFDAWVGALEKPHIWKQRAGSFESDGCFCAIGVLLRNDRWTKGLTRTEEDGVGRYKFQGYEMMAYPCCTYRNAVGLTETIADEIINMNDNGSTFPEIAKYLRGVRNALVG